MKTSIQEQRELVKNYLSVPIPYCLSESRIEWDL